MNRRSFLKALAALAAAPLMSRLMAVPAYADDLASAAAEAIRKRWRDFLAPGAQVASLQPPLTLAPAEWKKRLTDKQYSVLREEDTEMPFTSSLLDEHRAGVFVCAGCALPLFTSEMKFDSGTGWPSFFTTVPGAFQTKTDHALIYARTEYHCAKCGGHHGHVFDDGPRPTGQRWCSNGIVLRFIAKS